MFALIARCSKYDFWIPDEILTLEIKIQIKKYFFEIENFDRKKNRIFFRTFFFHPKIENIDEKTFWVWLFLYQSDPKFSQESKNHT